MTELVKVRFECDVCDGCGWYEGGTSLKTHCLKCEGKGYILIDEEKQIKHKWEKGEWFRDGADRYFTRNDKCKLCGCGRTMIKFKRGIQWMTCVSTYERSKQIFGHEHMPSCWGAMSPQ